MTIAISPTKFNKFIKLSNLYTTFKLIVYKKIHLLLLFIING